MYHMTRGGFYVVPPTKNTRWLKKQSSNTRNQSELPALLGRNPTVSPLSRMSGVSATPGL